MAVLNFDYLPYKIQINKKKENVLTALGGAGCLLKIHQDKLTTDKKPIVGYSIPDEIPTTCFQLSELV